MPRRSARAAAGPSAAAAFVVLCLTLGAGLAGAQSEAPLDLAPRRAFVTSTLPSAALGGLPGADLRCQELAAAASLPNPTGFVAWLSDSTTDAYCHVHGFAGKRVNNCGQAVLPAEAGPWVRPDGFPFADRIDRALYPTGRVFAPMILNETGAPINIYSAVWSGTNELGALHSSNPVPCSDWTLADAGQIVGLGASSATTESWLYYGMSNCSYAFHLVCLETGLAAPLPPHRSGGALAFVTSVDGSGDLGAWPEAGGATGLPAGDAICRALATTAGLPAPETFFAWLSSATVAAKDRLAYDGPWVRLDGVRIAESKADLTDGILFAPVGQTESGAYLSSYGAWTGTTAAGLADPARCGDWLLSDATQGKTGWPNLTSAQWTEKSNLACSSTWLRLYCFSDYPAVVFADDFESASCDAWSLVVP